MTLTNLNGTVRFKIAGQKAQPKWIQQQIQTALELQESPPESLRFQCRIATDARDNFKEIALEDGETLKLHPKAKPQFGKNQNGHPYLTTTMTYSGDGASYTIKWVGDAVPTKMQEVAVKHDQGLKAAPSTVVLDLTQATITPVYNTEGRNSQQQKNPAIQQAARDRYNQKVAQGKHVKRKRTCNRWTKADAEQRELASA